MKYTDVLTKKAADPVVLTGDHAAAYNTAVDQVKSEFDPSKVAPSVQEILRIALGASAGGGLGWLLSRLLHKKPKAWRTALYTLGGAAAGGLGTHWYINRKDDNGKSFADQAREDQHIRENQELQSFRKALAEHQRAGAHLPSKNPLDEKTTEDMWKSLFGDYRRVVGMTGGGVGGTWIGGWGAERAADFVRARAAAKANKGLVSAETTPGMTIKGMTAPKTYDYFVPDSKTGLFTRAQIEAYAANTIGKNWRQTHSLIHNSDGTYRFVPKSSVKNPTLGSRALKWTLSPLTGAAGVYGGYLLGDHFVQQDIKNWEASMPTFPDIAKPAK